MKVIYINSNYWPYARGGSEASVLAMFEGLHKLGMQAHVITMRPLFSKVTDVKQNVSYLGLINIYFPFILKERGGISKAIWHLIDLVNFPMSAWVAFNAFRQKPDLVHTNNVSGMGAFLFLFLKIFGLRVVHTPRDYYLIDQLSSLKRGSSNLNGDELALKLTNWHKKFFSRFIDRVVFTSEYMKQVHMKLGFFKGVESSVIYNGCDSIVGYKHVINKKEKLIFGYVGRPAKGKGLDLIVDIFSNNPVLKKHDLLLIGPTMSNLSQLLGIEAVQKNIVPLGYFDSKEFYKKIDVILVPSQWNEPFGRTCAEALLLGIPVIVSNCGGLPEQVFDKDIGLVCGNKGEWSYALENVCLGRLSFNFDDHQDLIRDKFSNSSMIKKFLNIYYSIAQR